MRRESMEHASAGGLRLGAPQGAVAHALLANPDVPDHEVDVVSRGSRRAAGAEPAREGERSTSEGEREREREGTEAWSTLSNDGDAAVRDPEDPGAALASDAGPADRELPSGLGGEEAENRA
eukprot:tig00000555_g2132.t1